MRGHQNPSYHRSMARYGIPDFPLKAEILAKQAEVIPLAPTPQIASRLVECMKLRMLPTEKRRGKKGCGLAICTICNLERSKCLTKQGAHFAYDNRLRGTHFTVVDHTLSTKADSIEDFDLKAAQKVMVSAVKDAQKALGTSFVAIVALEASLDEVPPKTGVKLTANGRKKRHRWSFHWHIIIICENPMLATPYLEGGMGVSKVKGERRLVPVDSLTIGRHIGYATKFEPERRAIVLDSNGNHDRKSRPLGKKRTKQLFQFLGEMPVSKRVLVLGNWKQPTDQFPFTP